MTEILVLIPARGGSKRLPRKNIKKLGGKSLIEWTVEAVNKSNARDAVCLISTDDEEIRREGIRHGCMAPWLRPAELARDDTSTFDVVIHAVNWWRNQIGADPKTILLMQPTSPFRDPMSIDRALELIKSDEVDAVVGVSSLLCTLNMFFSETSDGYLENLIKYDGPRNLVRPNGALYLIKTAALRSQKTFFPQRLKPIKMDERESIDIDTMLDWVVASYICNETYQTCPEEEI